MSTGGRSFTWCLVRLRWIRRVPILVTAPIGIATSLRPPMCPSWRSTWVTWWPPGSTTSPWTCPISPSVAQTVRPRCTSTSVLIDYIHVSGYLGKAAAALHPGDPAAAGQWADGQLLRVLHGRAKAVAATLASVARKTRANPRKRDLDLTDLDRAVTYLTSNCKHMRYDKALEKGWPIATGMIEGACRFVIEDRFGITGARWSPDGAETILKLRAVVVNGDLDDYMNYYKNRYRDEHHLARYDEDTIDRLNLAA